MSGYPTPQSVLDAVAAGAIVKRELIDEALAALGRDYVIDFASPAAQATLRDEHITPADAWPFPMRIGLD
jgi:hypothetical protein